MPTELSAGPKAASGKNANVFCGMVVVLRCCAGSRRVLVAERSGQMS